MCEVHRALYVRYIRTHHYYYYYYCSQNLIRELADIAVHICQIKSRSAGIFFMECVNKYFFVSGPSNQRVDYMGIKMSPTIPRRYVMAM